MDPDISYCAAELRRADPDRFYAAMSAPMPGRADLIVLWAFNLEVSRAPWVSAEPHIALMRLQWWRDALDEIYGAGAVRRHAVATPLARMIRLHGLPRGHFDTLISAQDDLAAQPKTLEQDTFLDHTGGVVFDLGWHVMSGRPAPKAALECARIAARLRLWQAEAALAQKGARQMLPPEPYTKEAAKMLQTWHAARHNLGDVGSAAPLFRSLWATPRLLRAATRRRGVTPPSDSARRLWFLINTTTGGW